MEQLMEGMRRHTREIYYSQRDRKRRLYHDRDNRSGKPETAPMEDMDCS